MPRKAFTGKILNPVTPFKTEFFNNGLLIINNNKIEFSGNKPDFIGNLPHDITKIESGFISPGFIDTHLHIPQVNQRARYGQSLMDWLTKYIYKAEENFSKSKNAQIFSINFFKEMLRNGTTTCLAYSSISEQATDIAFKIASKMGVRAFIGKVMMDFDPEKISYPPEKTNDSINASVRLMNKWHNHDNGRIQYAFTPRFAPSCTRELLSESSLIAKKNNCIIQSHLSENEEEISLVLKLFPECRTYTQVYEKYDCLYDKTVMAHCIHLSQSEIEILCQNDVRVAHCPSSNFFLKSGSINLKKIEKQGLKICLGTDVGAGPSFSLFDVIKSMNYMQPYNLLPQKCYYMATLGGAVALHIENVTGSLEKNKDADFIILNPESCYPEFRYDSIEDLLTFMYYLGSSSMVDQAYVRGIKVYDSLKESKDIHSHHSYLI